MIKILFFVVVLFVSILFVYANDCPKLKLAQTYIPKIVSKITGEYKSGDFNGKEIYKVKQLTENSYLITGKGGNSINLEEKCGLVSFELPFTIEEADENGQKVTIGGNYMCEGKLHKNKSITGTCMVEIELSNNKVFKDTLTFKWRPKK